jgi:plastocyanin
MKRYVYVLMPVVITLWAACAGLPTTSRTGHIATVTITDEDISPMELTVHPGDEVRMVNRRKSSVWVYTTRERTNEWACQRGFSYFLGLEESAKIEPEQSASVCFANTGAYGYWVQAQPSRLGGARMGQMNMPLAIRGAIIVEDSAHREREHH